MNARLRRRGFRSGYISYAVVLSLGVVLLLMMVQAYRSALQSQDVQADTQLRIDYRDKEDAVLRGIVSLLPNRAMQAMRDQSNNSSSTRRPMSWKAIFDDSLNLANARTSIDGTTLADLSLGDVQIANPSDSDFSSVAQVFDAIEPESGFVAPGVNRSLGLGYPEHLATSSSTVASLDREYPIVTFEKTYPSGYVGIGGVTSAEYPLYNVIPYPDIRFGYAKPGEPFVAKRNWWAFSVDLADHVDELTGMARFERDFIISLYEIPSQLAISAAAFANIGTHEDGTSWQHAVIDGGIFTARGEIEEGMTIERLAARRSLDLDPGASIDGNNFASDPFAPGAREEFEVANGGYLPVYLSSEAGRAAFVPLNRGADFFDRYRHAPENLTLSPTTWNQYSVGALQCAMRLDVIDVETELDQFPTYLRFEYMAGGSRQSMDLPLGANEPGLPPGYIQCCMEDDSVYFEDPVDVAYGLNGYFAFEYGVSGWVTFDNARFGDPLVGTLKAGYYKTSYPFGVKKIHGEKPCVVVYPERIPDFLDWIGADGPEVNHSLVVNADYVGNNKIREPAIPCLDNDIAVILEECKDLTGFPKGFSLVTNMRLYVGDDFNVLDTAPPAGSNLVPPFYPPASLFAPEKRYGTEVDPWKVELEGQLGSLADDAADGDPVRLLDLKLGSEENADPDRINANLKPIRHPAELPPINMMNWLIVIEERRREYYGEGAHHLR